MPVLAPGVAWVDLHFRGSPHVIATAIVSSAGGVALIDPGPASCLDALELGLNGVGIRLDDVTHILLTHVHRSVRLHMQSFVENLQLAAEWVRRSSEPGSDEEKARRYAEFAERELQRHLTDAEILPHRVGAPFEVSRVGLARYWRKRGFS